MLLASQRKTAHNLILFPVNVDGVMNHLIFRFFSNTDSFCLKGSSTVIAGTTARTSVFYLHSFTRRMLDLLQGIYIFFIVYGSMNACNFIYHLFIMRVFTTAGADNGSFRILTFLPILTIFLSCFKYIIEITIHVFDFILFFHFPFFVILGELFIFHTHHQRFG